MQYLSVIGLNDWREGCTFQIESAVRASFLQEDAQKQKAPGKGGQVEEEANLETDTVSHTACLCHFLLCQNMKYCLCQGWRAKDALHSLFAAIKHLLRLLAKQQ